MMTIDRRLQVAHLGLDAARGAAKKKVHDIEFTPKETSLDEPKEGIHDDKEHSGGNTYAGGVCLTTSILNIADLRTS